MIINGAEFKKWITARKRRNVIVQDLADDIKRDGRFPSGPMTPDDLRGYLSSRGACDGAKEALDIAINAFRAWKARQ